MHFALDKMSVICYINNNGGAMKKGFTLAGATHADTPPVHAKVGFTLAEVLITLGIIGVVAAMTLPALNANIRKKTTTARLKTFYSTMKQMLLLAEDNYGSVNDWDTSLPYPEFLERYFLAFLKGSKGSVNNKIYFVNGTSLTIYKGRCMDLIFDSNSDTSPNKEGYDRFRFLICDRSISEWCPDEGFCAYRNNNTKDNRDILLSQCRTNPAFCSGLLEHDHWEFLPDYPW